MTTENMTAKEYRRFMASGMTLDEWRGEKEKPKSRRQKPEADGILFDSAGERDCYLMLRGTCTKGFLYRQVRFPLLTLGPKSDKRVPMTWCPDFVHWVSDTEWCVHEFKGPKALESRDFRLRLAAFRRAFPSAGIKVWRKQNRRVVLDETLSYEPSRAMIPPV